MDAGGSEQNLAYAIWRRPWPTYGVPYGVPIKKKFWTKIYIIKNLLINLTKLKSIETVILSKSIETVSMSVDSTVSYLYFKDLECLISIVTGGNKTTSDPVILYYFLVSNKKNGLGYLSHPIKFIYLSPGFTCSFKDIDWSFLYIFLIKKFHRNIVFFAHESIYHWKGNYIVLIDLSRIYCAITKNSLSFL